MTLLILSLYLADVVHYINIFFGILTAAACLVAIPMIIALLLDDDDLSNEQITKFKNTLKSSVKVFILSACVLILTPSQKTIYISTGLTVGAKVLDKITTNPLYEKSLNLLEMKIDEVLTKGSR